jgi:hypothetical protein
MYLYLLLQDIQLTAPEEDMMMDWKMVVFTQAQVDVDVNYIYRCTDSIDCWALDEDIGKGALLIYSKTRDRSQMKILHTYPLPITLMKE